MTPAPDPSLPVSHLLTDTQTALWFGQQQVPGSPVYQCAERVDIRGDLDAGTFGDVLTRCLAAVPALNADYVTGPEGPRRQPVTRDHPVRFVDVAAATVKKAGGKVHAGPMDVPGGDRVIVEERHQLAARKPEARVSPAGQAGREGVRHDAHAVEGRGAALQERIVVVDDEQHLVGRAAREVVRAGEHRGRGEDLEERDLRG